MRVYARSVSPVLYIEWHWRGKRVQQSLKTRTGHPVTDRELAKDLAHDVARGLKDAHNRAARTAVFGPEGEHTLGGLLTRLHAARRWKDTKGPERFRDFWLETLGEETTLAEITPAMVEAAGNPKWGPKTLRHYRTYLVGAFNFAEQKLKWIEARSNLSAVDLPQSRGKSRAYTLDEVRALLPALEAVDVRAGWIGHVAWQTGRRLSAIRTLERRHVTLAEDYAVLHFPAETDKAGKEGDVAVVGRALALTLALMEKPGAYVCQPVPSKELAIKGWMPRAERIAGIEHLPGRGFHGLKRRFATEARGLVGRDKQAGTRGSTLEAVYVQDDLGPKLEVARFLSVSGSVSNA